MSFKQYMVLFWLFMGYLVLGAYMFYSVERPVEEERRALAKAEALEIKDCSEASSKSRPLDISREKDDKFPGQTHKVLFLSNRIHHKHQVSGNRHFNTGI
ncbi:hypothetical protein J6590_036223 [Homalodisca vitripennis]|nr:hypothetical protein J6590_036223 [Homalodisca vitripennis]